jgi:organic hydroperoxide reductase OsmC/OhrA
MKEHHYRVEVQWTGNTGRGTAAYRDYARSHVLSVPGQPKPPIPGSSDPAFRGDEARWNPEELLVGALSACHQLWYLHLCSAAGVVVTDYVDDAEGIMHEELDGGGHFARVVLRPVVTISRESDAARARTLHEEAHRMCFIARSVNFPVGHEPEIRIV